MKKKFFGLLVALVVMMPCLANAEEAENLVKIGETSYATLKDAVDAVEVCEDFATCEVTTINVLGDTETSGIVFLSGKKIIIDLGGFTVTFKEPTVGSKGTETQDMQILKNSTITFQNGKMVSSNSASSKMFIQNYANLTLKDVEIDATNEQNLYAVSNNSGDVSIEGTTSIKAKRVAFDVCGYSTYTIGPKVVVDTTGTIEGTIEVTKDATAANERALSLVIKNINHVGEISIQEGLEENVIIEKGAFTDEVATELAQPVEGEEVYEVLTLEGEYKVVIAEENDVEEGYFGLGFTEEGFEEVFGSEVDYETVVGLIDEKLADQYKAAIYYELVYGDLVNDSFVLGTEVTETLEKSIEVALDIPETIEKLKEGYTRTYKVIRIHYNEETDKYEADLLPAKEKDGKVIFETDRFSTYVLAYEDAAGTTNPPTFDGISLYMIVAVLSFVGLLGVGLFAKKKLFN